MLSVINVSLAAVVQLVLFFLIAAAVFGLLFFVIRYTEGKFPAAAPFLGILEWVLVILAVFVVIFLLLDWAGTPVFRFH